MTFKPKATKEKVQATYKSLYIKNTLLRQIEQIAEENHTSFNNVVISMIELCLDDTKSSEIKTAP